MRDGEFPDGSRVLRAKIDMQHENMQLRDPSCIASATRHHHRTGDAVWCIYPTYDWAHGQSDAIEGVTHSLCTLEFESATARSTTGSSPSCRWSATRPRQTSSPASN
jgi:glutaminyl-tRNA synthetase